MGKGFQADKPIRYAIYKEEAGIKAYFNGLKFISRLQTAEVWAVDQIRLYNKSELIETLKELKDPGIRYGVFIGVLGLESLDEEFLT